MLFTISTYSGVNNFERQFGEFYGNYPLFPLQITSKYPIAELIEAQELCRN